MADFSFWKVLLFCASILLNGDAFAGSRAQAVPLLKKTAHSIERRFEPWAKPLAARTFFSTCDYSKNSFLRQSGRSFSNTTYRLSSDDDVNILPDILCVDWEALKLERPPRLKYQLEVEEFHFKKTVPLSWTLDQDFVRRFEINPGEVYEEVKTLAGEARKKGESTFSFPVASPMLQRSIEEVQSMLNQLQEKLADLPPVFVFQIQKQLIELKLRAIALLSQPDYVGSMIFFLDWTRVFDQIQREQNRLRPIEKQRKYTHFYEENELDGVEEILKQGWPQMILFPTFSSLTIDYFLKTRHIPFYAMGLVTDELYADAFFLPSIELYIHDGGHAGFLRRHDLLLQIRSSLDPKIIQEKQSRNVNWLIEKLCEVQKEDPILGKLIRLLLFELVHERGFTYATSELKPQLETDRWTRVIEYKESVSFWAPLETMSVGGSSIGFSKEDLKRLSEARNLLWNWVVENAAIQGAQEYQQKLDHRETIAIHWTGTAQTSQGLIREVVIPEQGDIQIEFHSGEKVSIYDVGLQGIPQLNGSDFESSVVRLNENLEAFWTGDFSIGRGHVNLTFEAGRKAKLTNNEKFMLRQVVQLVSSEKMTGFVHTPTKDFEAQVLEVIKEGDFQDWKIKVKPFSMPVTPLEEASERVELPIAECVLI